MRRRSSLFYIPSSVIRVVKNSKRSYIEVLVRDCTSQSTEMVNMEQLKQLTVESANRNNFSVIFGILWRRTMDERSPVHVFKAVMVLLHIIQHSKCGRLYLQECVHHIDSMASALDKYKYAAHDDKMGHKIKDAMGILYEYLLDHRDDDDDDAAAAETATTSETLSHSLSHATSLSNFFADMTADMKAAEDTSDPLSFMKPKYDGDAIDIIFNGLSPQSSVSSFPQTDSTLQKHLSLISLSKTVLSDDGDDVDDEPSPPPSPPLPPSEPLFTSVDDVVNNERMWHSFKEYCVSDKCSQFVNCWYACMLYRFGYNDRDSTESLSLAMDIFDRYLAGATAVESVNAPLSLRTHISDYLTSPNGYMNDDKYPNPSIYKRVEAHLRAFLNTKKLPKFKRTAAYQSLEADIVYMCAAAPPAAVELEEATPRRRVWDASEWATLPRWIAREIEYSVDEFRDQLCRKRRAERHDNNNDASSVLLKRQEHRKLIIAEILSTEATYVNALNALVDVYYKPLNDIAGVFRIDKDDINALFNNIEDIRDMHVKFVCSLESAPDNVAASLLAYTPRLRIYAPYIVGYKHALNTYHKLVSGDGDENRMMASWFAEQAARPECKQSLESLLITVVQRIPRYELLCAELLRYTELSSPDIDDLFDAFRFMKAVASYINEFNRRTEQIRALSALQSRVTDMPTALSSMVFNGERGLIRHGKLKRKRTTGGLIHAHRRSCIGLLCTDMFIWYSRDHYRYKGHIGLANGAIVMEDLSHNDDENSFILIGGDDDDNHRLTLFCASDDEKQAWIKDISSAISDCQVLSRDPAGAPSLIMVSSVASSNPDWVVVE